MKKVILYGFILLAISILPNGCIENDSQLVGTVEGYKPVYGDINSEVIQMDAQPMKDPGKIYVFGNFLFVNEKFKGVHIIDNVDPRNPTISVS